MNITESLIKEYLVENYTSQAAGSETDRQVAEKAFKSELTNGPLKKVIMPDGGSFKVGVGSFDLENFHKAYDKWFEDNNLLDLFTNEGKLINSGTYGKLRTLDKTIPAVKAVLKLWGAQFRGEYEFLSDKLAKQKAEDDAAAAQVKLNQDQKDFVDRLNEPAVLDKITSTKEWKDLIDVYPAEMRDDIKPEVKVSFHYNDTLPQDVTLKITNVIRPPVDDPDFGRITINEPEGLSEADIIKQITDPEAVKKMLVGIKRIVPAAMLMINNYEEFSKRPEAKFDVIQQVFRDKNEWLVYFDRVTNKYYKVLFREFPINEKFSWNSSRKPGLMLIDLDDDKFKVGRLTAACVLVAARVDYRHSSGNTYTSTYYRDYYNSNLANSRILDKLGVITKPHQGNWNADYSVDIHNKSEFIHHELDNFFDKESVYLYTLDSSD